MKDLTIEQRIQILEDKQAIQEITFQYASVINQGWNGNTINASELNRIFSKDAIWESPVMGIREVGIENIIHSLMSETKNMMFSMHSYTNPILKLEGNTAFASWLFWVVSKKDNESINQVFMSQDIHYIKANDGWRIQNLKLHFGDIISTLT